MKRLTVFAITLVVVQTAMAAEPSKWQVEQVLDVAPVPAGFPVGFCLLTDGDRQYVAYYDAERWVCVARRKLPTDTWQILRLTDYKFKSNDAHGNVRVS